MVGSDIKNKSMLLSVVGGTDQSLSSQQLFTCEWWVCTANMTHDTWHMSHGHHLDQDKRLLIPTSRLGAYSRTSQLIHWGWYVSWACGVIIYSAGICECWPTYQWTNASASVCNEAVLCYKTFPCSKYFLFYSITDIFDNKINNLALWYINFIAQHFSVRLRTSEMWAIAIVKNNNHKSMQHYCINFEVVQFFHSKCLRSKIKKPSKKKLNIQ